MSNFSALREDSSAQYGYAKATVERYAELPADFGLVFSANGQYTETRLISTEQLLAGGYRNVRGF